MANTIFMKKTSGGCTLYLTTRRRRNFYNLNYTKYNKKPGFTSQQTQGKYKTKL